MTSAILIACTTALLGAPSLARDIDAATAAAIAKAKLQLAAMSEITAGAASTEAAAQGRWSAPPGQTSDAVARRLDAVFSVVLPDLAPAESLAEVARLPRPRPAEADDLVALAYAAEPATDAASSRGLSAIEALVEQHAEANNIPPALAQALVQVESTHNPKATGQNGEIGLLQIKPQTARAMGYKGSAQGLYDPETNLAWGLKYLGKAHDLSGGDTCGTLLRYNAGLDAKRQSAASSRFCAKVKKAMAEWA